MKRTIVLTVGLMTAPLRRPGLRRRRHRLGRLHRQRDDHVLGRLARRPRGGLGHRPGAVPLRARPLVSYQPATDSLGRQAPKAPVFLYHSVLDELIPFPTAQQLQADWCRGGAAVTLHADALSEHTSLAVTGAPLAVGYMAARFAGAPTPATCP